MGNSFLDEFPVIPLHVLHLLLYSPQRLKARELALIDVLPVFYSVGGNGQEGHGLHDINLQGWPHQGGTPTLKVV